MWRLTIKQKKTFASGDKGYTVEQEISYEVKDVYDILIRVGQLSKLETSGETTYEICEVADAKCVKEGETE